MISTKKISINSKKLYLYDKFDSIKDILKKNNNKLTDMGSFVCIDFDNYSFMLNEIFELDVYLRKNDDLLIKRINSIEDDIKTQIIGFSFEKDSISSYS